MHIGVGSGVLLAELAHQGAQGLWGVDINPDALIVSQALLAVEASSKPAHLLEGDMWEPLPQPMQFDIIVANLPHFPGSVTLADRPATWTGGEGRLIMDRFIEALPERLSQNGVAFITHHDLVGLQHTSNVIHTCEESLRYLGGYAFMDARILAIRLGHELKSALIG